MAQWVDCLLYKYQGLSPDPQHPYKDRGMVTQNCNPRSREVALGGSLELVNHPVQPISRLQVQWETLSQKKSRSNCGRSLTSASCFYRPTRVSTPEHTYRLSYNTHTQDNKLFRFNITVTSEFILCPFYISHHECQPSGTCSVLQELYKVLCM